MASTVLWRVGWHSLQNTSGQGYPLLIKAFPQNHCKYRIIRHIFSSQVFQKDVVPSKNTSQLNEWLGARLSSVLNNIQATQQNLEEREGNPFGDSCHSALPCPEEKEKGFEKEEKPRTVEVRHRWPEFMELVDRLVEEGYFVQSGSDDPEDVIDDVRSDKGEEATILRALRNATFRFARERFDIINSLSRRDIQIIASACCPNLNGKLVTSAKRLRAYTLLDEGDVCSTCSLRSSCQRAYIVPFPNDVARTFDIMRILLSYAYYPLIASAEAQKHINKVVITSVRKLLKQVVELSAVKPDLPKTTSSETFANVNQNQSMPKRKMKKSEIEMKKGDWLCPRCDFMNFAKNKSCLQCHGPRPKQSLKLGEWECPGCGFVNFRRNLACYKCECNRPQTNHSSDIWNSNKSEPNYHSYTEWKWKSPANMED